MTRPGNEEALITLGGLDGLLGSGVEPASLRPPKSRVLLASLRVIPHNGHDARWKNCIKVHTAASLRRVGSRGRSSSRPRLRRQPAKTYPGNSCPRIVSPVT